MLIIIYLYISCFQQPWNIPMCLEEEEEAETILIVEIIYVHAGNRI
jgi:hypothetical protein